MNLLIIDPADFIGGAELFTIDLINHFPKEKGKIFLATNGLEKYLNRLQSDQVTIEKIAIHRLKKTSPKSILNLHKAVKDIKKIINKYQIDLIQTNSIRAHIVGSLITYQTKTPLIWMVHDFTFPKFFARIFSKYPKKILTCSQTVKNDLKEKIPKKFHQKLEILPNSIDINKFKNTHPKTDLREQLSLKKETLLIGHVGRIDEWKGQHHLLHAAQKVAATLPKTHFIFIGDASNYDPATIAYKKKLENLTNELNLKSRVTFLGHQEEIIPILKQLNLLVHTSTNPEPFGRVIIEAMAAQIPVIASSRGGGPSEIITPHIDGLILDPTDHKTLCKNIIKLLESDSQRNFFVTNALDTIKKYSIEKMIEKITHIYEKII